MRVEKIVDGVRTRFFYEYSRVLLEQTGGYITGRNVYGTNLLMRAVGVDTFYYMYNAHADVTALVTPDGRIAATYDYDPFGNVIEKTGDADNNILFAGYQYDPETGLYYLNSRMYDPITARFLQEDTYTGVGSDPLSLNLYTYCYNSPLKYYDPTGHSPEYGAGGGMYGMPASVYNGYYKYKKTADSFKSKARGQQYMKAYNLAQTLDDDSKATILQGLDLMDSEDGKFYDYGIQSAASELIATDKSKLNSESISKLALKKQFSLYMDSLKVDPSTAEPSVIGFIDYAKNSDNLLLGMMGRTIDLAGQSVAGICENVKLAGQGVGNYVYSQKTAAESFINAVGTGEWDGFQSTYNKEMNVQKSILAGVSGGVVDSAMGIVFGIPGTLQYLATGDKSIFDGMSNFSNQYAQSINTISGGNIDQTYYNQGKGIANTGVLVASLALTLNASVKANQAKVNSTSISESAIRNRQGQPVSSLEKTIEMALDPKAYINAVVEKYGIKLKGSGQQISVDYNPELGSGIYGRTTAANPTVIEIGSDAFINEGELANTIAHELNHSRSFLRGGVAPESSAYAAGDALFNYINGGR